MIYVHLCITIITIAVTLYLFSKASQNPLSTIVKWIWYAAITVGFLILVCQLTTGLTKMFRGGGHSSCSYESGDQNCGSACLSEGHGKGHHKYKRGASRKVHKRMFKGKGECCGQCDMGAENCHMINKDREIEWEEKVEIDTSEEGKVIEKKIIIKKGSGINEGDKE